MKMADRNLKPRQEYHGFKLLRKETIDELKSEALFFEHVATGAELLSLECDDDNKVFSVTFRTPPKSDHGVAHILEHSVLCGSRKYPVKEPFIELVKGSLQTFLNAMTFPDKTMYPLASRNRKDFYNLMDVYLDAVFHPRITREIFMQEGWHYELDAPDEDIVYKGVVYNEMKGVFSSPESLIDRLLTHALFPGTAYGCESGGDPQVIPQLTYEEFLEFHRRLYHPSNSRIFFYGDGNTLEYLQYLQENYLKEFTRHEADSAITAQRRFRKPKRKQVHYAVGKKESVAKKTYVLVGLKLGRAIDSEHCLGFHVLNHLLLGTAASPLRKALIDSGLGSEIIGGGFDDQRMETFFAVGLKGAEPENEQKIIDLIFTVLRDLAEKGIDGDMVKAAVNTVDFRLREANFGGFPKGIVYNIQALGSWLYGADPLLHLRYEKLIVKIQQESERGYFEGLIRKYLLDNSHQVIVVGTPKPGLAQRQEARVRKELRQVKASLDANRLDEMVKTTQALKELQSMPDSPEDLARLPQLGLEDIDRRGQVYPIEVKKEKGPKILFHDLFANRIAYTQIGFNTQVVPLDKIQYLPLFGKMILSMGTKKRNYVEMTQRIGIHTGGIRSSHFASALIADRGQIISYIFFNGKALMGKLGELFDIYRELFGEFTFENSKRLVEIIRSAKADMEESIIPSGNHYVLSRLQSYHSRLGQYDEMTDGIAYYKFLEKLLARAEKDPAEVAEQFRQVAGLLFRQDNMLANITGEAADYPAFERETEALSQVLPVDSSSPVRLEFDRVPMNEGFPTASAVQYVGKGANLYEKGFQYTGKFDVLKSLLGTAYLWERVRIQGGAYGSSSSFDKYSGDFTFISYRDPNLEETLSHYDAIPEFLSDLDMSREELTKLVIGCVGHLDPPLTPDRKGSVAMVEHLTGITPEWKQQRRDELLATTVEDLRAFAPLFQKIRDSGAVCVLGSEEKIKKASKRFDHIVKIFQ
jgi:hypothetical protein